MGEALDFLFPRRCYGCGKEGRYVCARCFDCLPRLAPPYCEVCAEPLGRSTTARLCDRCWYQPLEIEGIRAPFRMEDPIRRMIYDFKYRNVRDLAPLLGALAAEYYVQSELETDVLVPVPLHPWRERNRGYNQSALLAGAMSEGLRGSLPVDVAALRRTRNTPQQARSMAGDDRRGNVVAAFAAEPERVGGKHILLVDDVCTTGATLEACAVALAEAGASSVWALALAREV